MHISSILPKHFTSISNSNLNNVFIASLLITYNKLFSIRDKDK